VFSKKSALLHDACILDEKKMEKLRGMNLPVPRFRQEDIPEGVAGIYGYTHLQTFYPTLNKVFRLNKFQTAKFAYELPATLTAVDCSGNQGFCSITLQKNGGLVKTRAFLKVTHLLDPVRWMQGRYSLPQQAGLPGHSKTWAAAWHKLQDPWNQAYVEALATFALGGLRSAGISPHFNEFYGAYCARAETYHFNINEDYQSFRNSRWFWNGKEKGLYHLKVVSSVTPDVEPPEEIVADILTKPDISDEDEDEEDHDDEDEDEDEDDENEQLSHEDKDKEKEKEEEVLEEVELEDVNEDESLCSASMESKSFEDEDAEDAEDTEEAEEAEEGEQYIVYATLPEFPVMLIFTEPNENTMDSLLDPKAHSCEPGTEAWEGMWSAWIFQVIAALTVMQKVLGMTHNDLHTNNIVYTKTDEEFLYYKAADGTVWKVPTYGKIFRLIDFGRSIFTVNKNIVVSDDFRPGNDADGQYSFKPLTSNPHEIVEPNPSFDLSRLAVSLFEPLFPAKPAESENRVILSEEEGMIVRETVSPLFNCLWSWMVDEDDKNILIEPNGDERFPDFDLYKHIAAKIHNAEPAAQIHKMPFSQFKTNETVEKAYSLFV
jgi:hypothetical protein